MKPSNKPKLAFTSTEPTISTGDMMTTTQTATIGSVSHGTMREEDLIPCFMEAVDDLKESESLSDFRDPGKFGALDDALGAMERRVSQPQYYESDDVQWDMEWLKEVGLVYSISALILRNEKLELQQPLIMHWGFGVMN